MKAATSCGAGNRSAGKISIHAAREGGDRKARYDLCEFQFISIHAAREGGDAPEHEAEEQDLQFQSTPPVKAATSIFVSFLPSVSISIHAAREGGDSPA